MFSELRKEKFLDIAHMGDVPFLTSPVRCSCAHRGGALLCARLLTEREQQGAVSGMIRSAASKVMCVGRATVFLVGLAVILAVVFGIASTAAAKNGDFLKLGTARNVATLPTTLVGRIADATKSALVVKNTRGGPALELHNSSGDALVDAERVPMTVDTQGRVENLNADFLDNKSSEEFAEGVNGKALDASHADEADTATNAQNANTLGGKTAGQFANATHAHSGGDITSGTVAEGRIDGSIARDDEVMPTVKANDGAGSGVDADTLDGQNSSAFASSSHNHDGRYYFSGSKVADSDKLDGKDSSAFAIRTAHNWSYAHDCDTPFTYNECAPVTVTVPAGKTYYVSVWSSFTASQGTGGPQDILYCSAGKGPSIDTTNPCVTPFGINNVLRLHDYTVAASSSGETVPLLPGTYTFFTAIKPTFEQLGLNNGGKVITKVMVRDTANSF